ncbi:G2/mitotic-specific cyclin-A-like isoform X2 [Euwallacea similis]|uniref:G2/mitotic-specific cyclin-A-like isoform X2 n=1 Tax=Euwallacea similis TaxID=1736056 RepID=UPI00344C89ED
MSREYEIRTKHVCLCPGIDNQKYVRKSDRPPLANIQCEALHHKGLDDKKGKEQMHPKLCRKLSCPGLSRYVSPQSSSQPRTLHNSELNHKFIKPTSQPTELKSTPKPTESTRSSKKFSSGPTRFVFPSVSSYSTKQRNSESDQKISKPASKLPVIQLPQKITARSKSTSCYQAKTHILTKEANTATFSVPNSGRSRNDKEIDDVFLFPKHAETKTVIHNFPATKARKSSDINTYVYDANINFKIPINNEQSSASYINNDKTRNNSSGYSSDYSEKSQEQAFAVVLDPIEAKTLPSLQFLSLCQETCNTLSPSMREELFLEPFGSPKRVEIKKVNQYLMATEPSNLNFHASSSGEDLYFGIEKGFVRVTRDTSIVAEKDVPFINGAEFFSNLDRGNCPKTKTKPMHSPLEMPALPKRSISISGSTDGTQIGICKVPAVKNTLKRRKSQKTSTANPFWYCPVYGEDMISYSLLNRKSFMLKYEWVEMYIDKRERTNTLNWLSQVTQFINIKHESTYFMAVRLFDYSIVSLKLRCRVYNLTAIVALWICDKYLTDSGKLKASKIFSLCDSKYSKQEILSMEKNIVKAAKFCLNMSDPLDILYFYMKSFNLEENNRLLNCAKFALECAVLFETYSLVDSHFLVASILHMSYKRVYNLMEVPINFERYDRKQLEKFVEKVVDTNIKYAIMKKYEVVIKYIDVKKLHVAKLFF